MFEAVFAAFLAIGHLLARPGQVPLLRYVHPHACVIAAATLATTLAPELYTAKDVLVLPSWLPQQREHEAATINAVQVIDSQPGSALCSTPAQCYWAGKSSEVDSFNFGEAVLTRQKPLTAVRDRIAAGYYGSIELYPAWDDLTLPANSPGDSGGGGTKLPRGAGQSWRVVVLGAKDPGRRRMSGVPTSGRPTSGGLGNQAIQSASITVGPATAVSATGASRLLGVLHAPRRFAALALVGLGIGAAHALTILPVALVLGAGDFWMFPRGLIHDSQNDMAQVLVGQLFLERDAWGWPLLHAADLGFPAGTNIFWIDTVPIVGLAAKLLAEVVHGPVNLLGFDLLGCLVLPGLAMTWVAGHRHRLAAITASAVADAAPLPLYRRRQPSAARGAAAGPGAAAARPISLQRPLRLDTGLRDHGRQHRPGAQAEAVLGDRRPVPGRGDIAHRRRCAAARCHRGRGLRTSPCRVG